MPCGCGPVCVTGVGVVRCSWERARRKWAGARSWTALGTAGVFGSSLDGEAVHDFLHCGFLSGFCASGSFAFLRKMRQARIRRVWTWHAPGHGRLGLEECGSTAFLYSHPCPMEALVMAQLGMGTPRAWTDGSAALRNTECSSRGPRFYSQGP